jgi:hypothetical protein
MQASYFAIKSSHSATPIFSPLVVVVVVVVVVLDPVLVGLVVVVLAGLVELVELVEFDVPFVVFESDPPQADNKSAQEMESASVTKILLAI